MEQNSKARECGGNLREKECDMHCQPTCVCVCVKSLQVLLFFVFKMCISKHNILTKKHTLISVEFSNCTPEASLKLSPGTSCSSGSYIMDSFLQLFHIWNHTCLLLYLTSVAWPYIHEMCPCCHMWWQVLLFRWAVLFCCVNIPPGIGPR